MPKLYIGLMSGTSLDAADAALVECAPSGDIRILAAHSEPITADLRIRLQQLLQPDAVISLPRLGDLHQQVGAWLAQAALAVMQDADVTAQDIAAIGSHGQTVWHAPAAQWPYSMQLGSASHIAARTGCTVVADFRNADMALGGQGAPLVPAFHRHLLASAERARIVVNIGGMANLTILPRSAAHDPTQASGLDTGPGNTLMDGWIQAQLGEPMDENGQWAASGRVHEPLLQRMLQDRYFQLAPPKSTGREYFNQAWLQAQLKQLAQPPAGADVQATLCALSGHSIAKAIAAYGPGNEEILVCGGGARNVQLMACLQRLLAPRLVTSTAARGIDPQWVEAAAFAWLAMRRLQSLPGNLPRVTGARAPAVLGCVYLPPPVSHGK